MYSETQMFMLYQICVYIVFLLVVFLPKKISFIFILIWRLKSYEINNHVLFQKRIIKRKKRQPVQEAATAQEAIQKIIQEKKISCKINYDVLNDLKVKTDAPKSTSNPISTSILKPEKQSTGISRLRKSSISFDLRLEVRICVLIALGF